MSMSKTFTLSLFLLFACFRFAFTNTFQINPPLNHTKDPCIVFVPKAFSPNGDGINDMFSVKNACSIQAFSLKIYDQRKQLVYEDVHLGRAWDGTCKGKPVPEGQYNWQISYESEGNRKGTLKGNLILIR